MADTIRAFYLTVRDRMQASIENWRQATTPEATNRQRIAGLEHAQGIVDECYGNTPVIPTTAPEAVTVDAVTQEGPEGITVTVQLTGALLSHLIGVMGAEKIARLLLDHAGVREAMISALGEDEADE